MLSLKRMLTGCQEVDLREWSMPPVTYIAVMATLIVAEHIQPHFTVFCCWHYFAISIEWMMMILKLRMDLKLMMAMPASVDCCYCHLSTYFIRFLFTAHNNNILFSFKSSPPLIHWIECVFLLLVTHFYSSPSSSSHS